MVWSYETRPGAGDDVVFRFTPAGVAKQDPETVVQA